MSGQQSLPNVDITAFMIDCAENYLTVTDPFLSHPMKDDDDEHDDAGEPVVVRSTSGSDASSSEFFSLHEAMAASQLMDRKMDCCEIPAHLVAPWHAESDDRVIYPRPIPTSLEDPMTPLPWNDLTIQSAAYICIEIIVRLQSLVSGSAVGESTFTCLYAHSAILQDMKARLLPSVDTDNCTIIETDVDATPSLESRLKALQLDNKDTQNQSMACKPREPTTDNQIAQWCVFACSMALVELTDSVRSIILNADIYEEEDFVSNTHNLPFYILRKSTDQNNGNSSGRSTKNVQQVHCDEWNTIKIIEMAMTSLDLVPSSDHTKVLRFVLGYQSDLLSICSTMGRLSDNDLLNTLETTQARVRQAVQKLAELQAIVVTLLNGNTDESNPYSQAVQLLLQRCFDSYVNRVLVGNLPIRKISFQQPALAIATMSTITSEIDTCVCNLLIRGSTLGRMQRMLDHAATTNILSRSMLLLNLYFNEKLLGQFELRGLLVQHMVQWQASPEGMLLSSDDAVAFVNRLAKPVYDTMKLKLLNRNRQRAYIDVVMLPEWILIQNEANLADYHFQKQSDANGTTSGSNGNSNPSTYFTRYVLSILLRLMDRYVEAGLEVGLFLNNHRDLSFAYWYRDFLLSALSQNLSVMRRKADAETATTTPTTAVSNPHPCSKSKGKKKHSKHKITTPNGRHNDHDVNARPIILPHVNLEDELELKVIAVKRNMCRKTIQFLAGLTQVGILKEQHFEFTSLQRIFENRFEVFAGIRQPPPLTFQDFEEGNDFSAVPSNELLQSVTEGFQYCRTFLEHILLDLNQNQIDPMYAPISESELRALMKVCLGNSIYVQKVHQIVASGEATRAKAVFDFGSHHQFCIVKVTL